MKKFWKIFLPSLLLSGLLALSLCYIIIPERTKCAVDIVVGYLNTPIGIGCGCSLTIGMVLTFIVKLIYDKYKVSVRDELGQAKQFAEEQKNQAKDYYDIVMEYKEDIKTTLNGFSARIDNVVDNVCKICETSPNAKIKALGEEIKNGSEEIKQDVKEELERQENNFAGVCEERHSVKELENKVNELTEKLERLVSQYEEREERVDSSSNEE